MYVVRHKKNNNYYSKKISNNLLHYVRNIEEAHRFKNKKQAEIFLEKFIYKEDFELIKI